MIDGEDEISAFDQAIYGNDEVSSNGRTPKSGKRGAKQTRSGRTTKRRRMHDDYESSNSDSNSDIAEVVSKPQSVREESSDEENDPDWRDAGRRSRTRPQTYNVKALFQNEMAKPRPTGAKRGRPRGSLSKKPNPRLPQIMTNMETPEKKELDVFFGLIPHPTDLQPEESARIFTMTIYGLNGVKMASGGFQHFVQWSTDQVTLDLYTYVAEHNHFPEDSDDVLKIAQTLRHVWNKLPAATRKSWELAARDHARAKKIELSEDAMETDEKMNDAPVMPVNEVPYKSVHRYAPNAVAPLCCPGAQTFENFADVKRHFLKTHYSSFFYACHFCMHMFESKKQLMEHTTCGDFPQFLINRIVSGKVEEPDASVCYLFVNCYECGLWMPIRDSYTGEKLEQAWAFFSTVCKYHSNETLNFVVVYAVDELVNEGSDSVFTFKFMPKTITNLPLTCNTCEGVEFKSGADANEHLLKHEPLTCKCGEQFGTESHLRNHILTHMPSKVTFGRYLRDSACVYPPAHVQGLPRVGFSKGNVAAVGGSSKVTDDDDAQFDFVDHCEPLLAEKLRNTMLRKKAADVEEDDEEGFCDDQARPDMGHETADYSATEDGEEEFKTKELLNKVFCKQMNEKSQFMWADQLKNWAGVSKTMNISPEMTEDDIGEKTKDLFTNRFSMAEDLADQFLQTVTLPTQACFDSVSEGILNKNYDICDQCSVIFERGFFKHDCDASKVFPVYRTESPSNSRLSCHLCDEQVCSVYGLRSHYAWDHLRHVESIHFLNADEKKINILRIALSSQLKGYKSLIARRTDIALKMGPVKGILRVRAVVPRLPTYMSYTTPARRPMVPTDARRYPVSIRPMTTASPPVHRGNTVKPYLEGTNGRIGYTCRFCQFSTADMRKMREHLRISHTIICRGCGHAFAYQNTLTDHEKTCHRPFGKVPVGNMFGSCVCCRRTDPLPRLYTHIFESHLNLICYGTACGKIYRKDTSALFVKDIHVPAASQMAVAALKTSISAPSPPIQREVPNFECYLCGFVASSSTELNKHIVRHTENFATCPFCIPAVSICSHEAMKNHLRTVHYRVKDSHHVCNFCAQVQELNNVSHTIYHCVMSKRCALCPYSAKNQFETPEELRAHWRTQHHKQFNRFGCSECRQTFPSLGAFRGHTCKLVEMAHRCDCGEVFPTRGDYVDHFWVHVDAHRTHCQLCPATFTQTLSIGQHRMNHGKLIGSAKQRKIKILDESLFIEDCKQIVEVVEVDNDSNGSYPTAPSPASDQDNLELDVEKVVRKLVKDTCLQLGEAFEEGDVDDTDDALNAAVRTEQIDQQDESHHPGYVEEGDELEYCPSPSTNIGTAILRTVDDNNADDDICVVAEVEHPTGTLASNLASRDKKFKCGMCSMSFVTKASLTEHEVKSHKNDVGGTLEKAYGMPLEGQTWLCRNCCVAFESPSAFRRHSSAHGMNSGISCPQCSGISYNYPLFEQHQACHRKTDKSRMLFGCGTCMKMFYTDSRLYHHMNIAHQIPLLFFCKCCSICSPNLNVIFDHINKTNICRSTLLKKNFKFLQMLGAFPANLVHYQPNSPETYENMLRGNLIKAVRPSECSHRSFLTLTDSVITCKECHCTMSSASFYANEAFLNNGVCKDMTVSLDDSYDFPFQREFQNHQVTKHRLIYHQATGTLKAAEMPTVRHQIAANPRYMPVSHVRPVGSQMIPNAKIAYPLKPGSVVATLNRTTGPGVRTNLANSSSISSTANLVRPHVGPGRPKTILRPTGVQDDDIITLDDGEGPSTSVATPPLHRPQAHVAPVQKSNHCDVCKAVMTGPKVKRLHELHKSGKAWFCLDCANGQKTEEEVVKHYYTAHIPDGQKHHTAKGIPGEFRPMVFDLHCPINACKQAVKTLNELRKHLDSAHANELKFHSSHCTSKFATEEALKAHEKAHEDFDDISGGMGGICCQLCGVANQWNLQCEILGAPKMISHLAMHGLHTYSMCRDCFTCFPGDVDNSKMIKHYEAAHATAAGVGQVKCNLCALEMTREQLYKHGLEKHIVRGYKTRAKAQNQLMVKVSGITRHFMGLPQAEDEDDS